MNNETIIEQLDSYAADGALSLEYGRHDRNAVDLLHDQCGEDRDRRMWFVNYYLRTKHGMQDGHFGLAHIDSVKLSKRSGNGR